MNPNSILGDVWDISVMFIGKSLSEAVKSVLMPLVPDVTYKFAAKIQLIFDMCKLF